MSTRDKKLLIYLGAIVILAAAYIFVGQPYLDKIDSLTNEKVLLSEELSRKREAYDNRAVYEQGIMDAKTKIDDIIAKFPEDNTEEKSIMFASHAEADIPIWFSQMNFATETQTLVDGGEVPTASDEEQEQLEENVETAEGEESTPEGEDDSEGGERGVVTESSVGGLIGRDTELGLSFEVEYEEFKKFLSYIRDYDDRIVIKDINFSYSEYSDLVTGTATLSQYAILGEGRQLPEVITDVDNLGTDNIFTNSNKGGSIIDLLADIASDFINKIMGGLSEESLDELGTDYFVKVNAVTDNTNGKTIGRADDTTETTYITSSSNKKEDVIFQITGSDGNYSVNYKIGDAEYTDTMEKNSDGKIYLRAVSTIRMGNDDDSAVSIHVINKSDIPVVVNIEGDDNDRPRVSVTEKVGNVTVNGEH